MENSYKSRTNESNWTCARSEQNEELKKKAKCLIELKIVSKEAFRDSFFNENKKAFHQILSREEREQLIPFGVHEINIESQLNICAYVQCLRNFESRDV